MDPIDRVRGAEQKLVMGPHVNALQIKRMDGAGSTVVQAPDQEPRAGVQGSLPLIFVMGSTPRTNWRSGVRMRLRVGRSGRNSVSWRVI
ncbi:MAG: hypothetical protein HOI07_05230 [Betaproteobacteria bacterium]|nr:hypothetical protein [Betaproteobacteria bacterium]